MEKRKRNFSCGEEINRRIAAELTVMRNKENITQEEIAKRMGVSRQTVTTIETATRNISLTKVIRYAKALGITLEITIPPGNGELYLIRRRNRIIVGFNLPDETTRAAPDTLPTVPERNESSCAEASEDKPDPDPEDPGETYEPDPEPPIAPPPDYTVEFHP